MPATADTPPHDGLAAALAEHGIELEGIAGRGGSGVVHRGRRADGVPVAIKVLTGTTEVGRIRREAEALDALTHTGVPRLLGVFESDGRPVLVSEWIDGTRLAEELRAAPLPPARSLTIFASLADVLDHVHARGLVHRDLSPANIIVRPDDTVALIDFGVSRGADTATLTADGITAGTPRYLAPELLRGESPTPASDQYAAGILLSELVTGRWPFPSAGDTVATTMHHHLHSAVEPASERNPWLGTAFDAAIERSVAKAPGDRFPSVSAMVDAIGEPNPAAAIGGRAGRRWTATLLGAAMLLIVIAGVVLVRSGDPADGVVDPIPAGTAASLDCNLLVEPDFESGTVPAGFYDGVAANNDIAPAGGVDRTAAVRVGATGDFGLYGETVPIVPGEGYVFRAFVAPTADVQQAVIRLFTLDQNFDLIASPTDPDIGIDEVELELSPGRAEHVALHMPTVAPAARFLVPSLVKEGPDGYLLADELVLHSVGARPCDALVGR